MKHKQMLLGAMLSYGTIAFNMIAGLLYTPWVIRTVGNGQYALYTLAMSIINIFMLDFGLGQAVSKFLSEYYARGQTEKVNRFMAIVYKVFAAISAGIAVGLGIFYCNIERVYGNLTGTELDIFRRLFIMVSVYSVSSFPFTTFQGILMANEQFVAVKLCSFGQKLLDVVLVVAALLAGCGVYALVMVHALSNLLFLLVQYAIIKRKLGMSIDFSCWDQDMAKSLFDFSRWVTVGNIASRFIFNIMPTLITVFHNSAAVTAFSLSAVLEGYVFSFAEAVNGMFLPVISRTLSGDHPEKELSKLMNRMGLFHIGTIGLIFLGFLCLGREFVSLWMGPGYETIWICTVFLVFPSILDIPQQTARTALLAKGIVKEQAQIYLGMALVNIGLSLFLIPRMGAAGAAVSVCCAYLFRTGAFNRLYHKRLQIDLKSFWGRVYGRWMITAAFTVPAGNAISHMTAAEGWGGLLVKIILIAILYSVIFLLVGIPREGKKYLGNLLKRQEI